MAYRVATGGHAGLDPVGHPAADKPTAGFLGASVDDEDRRHLTGILAPGRQRQPVGQRIVLKDAALVVVDDDAVVRGAVLDVELGGRE